MKFDPRYLELAGAVLAGIATDEEKLELKTLKAAVKKEIKTTYTGTPEGVILNYTKRIAKLQKLIDVIRDTGVLPVKGTGVGKRGRPAKSVTA